MLQQVFQVPRFFNKITFKRIDNFEYLFTLSILVKRRIFLQYIWASKLRDYKLYKFLNVK